MPFVELDGCNLYYETHGSGPALIFAHGLGGNHLSWWQQVPHFRDRYTCVTFAHRGFYPSDGGPDGAEPEKFTDDLTALIDHLGFEDVRLVGQSMGGWSCLDYALRFPHRVRALVMACTVGSLAPVEGEHELRDDSASAALFARGIHPAAGERLAREQPAMHLLYREIDALSTKLDKEPLRRTLMAMRTTPPERVATLTVPVLCITGEEDVVIPPALVEALASLIPGARLARVPEAGHSVYFERPQAFNALLDEFLT